MNKFILAAVLAVSAVQAHAASWVVDNTIGGQIVLTDEDCYFNGVKYAPLKRVFARNSAGVTLEGCWYYKDGIVNATYNDNSSYTYPAKIFTKLETY